MDKVLVDIRQETDSIKEYFKGQDTVSVEDLLNTIDNLIYEKHCLEEESEDKEDAWEPDPFKVWRDMNG